MPLTHTSRIRHSLGLALAATTLGLIAAGPASAASGPPAGPPPPAIVRPAAPTAVLPPRRDGRGERAAAPVTAH